MAMRPMLRRSGTGSLTSLPKGGGRSSVGGTRSGLEARTTRASADGRLMDIPLTVKGDEISGEFAVALKGGTAATARDKLVDDLLTEPLYALARKLSVVVGSDPHHYAHPLEGRDAEGRTVFSVRGRLEGDVLVPVRAGKRRK